MKITQIKLTGFKRFILNEIHSFEMTLTQAVQIILGTNGCGKSSLLDQLSPLPATLADFDKDTGSKTIWIEHKASAFVLSSVFSPGQKHSFLKDGIEINDGGTITVQRELVKQHFGITQEIHNLVMGYEPFHLMTPNRRKDWFVKLCDTDYSYAIRVYGKAKEKLRDVQGALKMAKKRLIAEAEKQLKSEEEQVLLEDVKMLHARLDTLMSLRQPREFEVEVLSKKQAGLDARIAQILKTRAVVLKAIGGDSGLQAESVSTVLQNLQQSLAVANSTLNATSTSLDDNKKKIAILATADHQTTQSIHKEIDEFDSKLIRLRKSLNPEFIIDASINPEYLQTSLDACEAQIIEIANGIPENNDRRYSRVKLNESKERLAELNRTRTLLVEQIAELAIRIKHMEDHKSNPDVTCEKCSHRFSLKYDPQLHSGLALRLQENTARLEEKIKPEIAALEVYFEQCGTYATYFKYFVNLKTSHPALKGYFDYFEAKQFLYVDANSMITSLPKIRKDVKARMEIAELSTQMAKKTQLLDSLKTLGGGDLRTLREIAQTQQEQINTLTTRLVWLRSRHKHYKSLSDLIQKHDKLVKDAQSLLSEKETLAKQHMNAIRVDLMHQLVKNVQAILGSKEYVLQQSRLQKSVLLNLEQQISEMLIQEEALTALVQALSPTDGLIAEGLLGFINEFVAGMNVLIEKVWNYPMVIVPCAVDEQAGVDLDYRFPLQLQQQTDKIPDVSRGSRGQIEICDLAFKLSAMAYLGLTDGTLILDEMGSALDHEHKSALIFLIKNLIEHETFTQVCLVSHDYGQYTSLNNAQVCVLCDRNIMLPPKSTYNQHVVMA